MSDCRVVAAGKQHTIKVQCTRRSILYSFTFECSICSLPCTTCTLYLASFSGISFLSRVLSSVVRDETRDVCIKKSTVKLLYNKIVTEVLSCLCSKIVLVFFFLVFFMVLDVAANIAASSSSVLQGTFMCFLCLYRILSPFPLHPLRFPLSPLFCRQLGHFFCVYSIFFFNPTLA